MAGELGIGVPVFVGFVPSGEMTCAVDGRLKRGVIVDGPENVTAAHIGKPVFVFWRWFTATRPARFWMVNIEGRRYGVDENYLTPIDDGEEATDTEREREAVT